MLSFSLVPLLVSVLVPAAFAQDDSYLTGLISALNDLGLTSLTRAASQANGTEQGATLLSTLVNGNFTIFAPSNSAFEAISSNTSNSDSLITSILSYHILPGDFSSVAAQSPNHTVARTLLNESSGLVNLEGNINQVLAWTILNDNVTILNQGNGTNVTVLNSTSYQNIFINEINGVLIPPPSLATVVNETALNLTSLAGLLNQTPSTNESQPSLLAGQGANSSGSFADQLDNELRGFTLFAPNNDAFNEAQGALQSIALNMSAASIVLRNHLINGSTIYSPYIASMEIMNATSAAGEPVYFTSNSSGAYVTVGGSDGNFGVTARIVQSDILAKNGVVHIVDMVLAVTNSDEEAAVSAAASASSVAAGYSTMATSTAPLGQPTESGAQLGSDSTGDASKVVPGTGILSILLAVVVGLHL